MKKVLCSTVVALMIIGLFALKPELLTYLPISSEMIGPAKGIITFNQLKEDEKALIFRESDTVIFRGNARTTSPTTIAKLNDARIYRSAGFVITKEDLLYRNNAVCWDYKRIEDMGVLTRLFLPRTKRYYDERIAVIASHGGGNCYFHWMIDMMLKIIVLKESGLPYDKVYLPVINKPYQRETLALMGLDPKMWIQGDNKSMIKAKEVLVPNRPGEEGSWLTQVITPWMVEKLNSLYPDEGIEPSKNIYISRKKATRRRVLNEEELIKRLEVYGFECFYLEDLSVKEQARIFRSAKFIIAPHGAGLTNLVFAKEGIKMIEFMHPHWICDCFEEIASIKKMNYNRIPLVPAQGPCDGTIDIEAVETRVKELRF